jgi:hypothetical protein
MEYVNELECEAVLYQNENRLSILENDYKTIEDVYEYRVYLKEQVDFPQQLTMMLTLSNAITAGVNTAQTGKKAPLNSFQNDIKKMIEKLTRKVDYKEEDDELLKEFMGKSFG